MTTVDHKFGSGLGALITLSESEAQDLYGVFDNETYQKFSMESGEIVAFLEGDTFVEGKRAWLIVGPLDSFDYSNSGSSFALAVDNTLSECEKKDILTVIDSLKLDPQRAYWGAIMFHSVF